MKLSVGIFMETLIYNETVEVIVDGFGGDVMILLQVGEHRQFKMCWNRDNIYIFGIEKTIGMSKKYTFLGNDAMPI